MPVIAGFVVIGTVCVGYHVCLGITKGFKKWNAERSANNG